MNIYLVGMYESLTVERLMAEKSTYFAHFSAVGTWWPSPGELCKACGSHNQDLVEPLQVEWEPSPVVIGDFSWDGPFGSIFIVKDAVADFFQEEGFECELLRVEYVPPTGKWKKHRVPYPYEGPRLRWGECKRLLDLDMVASEVTVKRSCTMCGRIRYVFRNNGIVIRRKNWHGEKMFRITTNGKSAATFVTEEGRNLIEAAGFTNIAFTHAGEIVD